MEILLFLLAAAVLAFIVLYNTLVRLKNRVENTFASIDVMLKKRYDLIPDLVATAKNYMQHEERTLSNIAALRSQAISAQTSDGQRLELENQLSREIGNLLVAVEAYPDLKADQSFKMLQMALIELEEQLSAARRFFNTAVTDYNNAVEMFPTNIVAGIMSYRRKPLFEIPETQRQKHDVGQLFQQ